MSGKFFKVILVAMPILIWALTFAVEPLQDAAFPRHSLAAIIILFLQWIFYFPLVIFELDHNNSWIFSSLIYSFGWSFLFWLFGRYLAKKRNPQQGVVV